MEKEIRGSGHPAPQAQAKEKEADYHLHIQGAGACDNIIGRLNAGNFTFRSVSLDESPEVKEQLGRFLSRLAQRMDFPVGPLITVWGSGSTRESPLSTG